MNGNLTIDEILDTRNVTADEFLNSVKEFEKEQITKTLIEFEKSPGSNFETYKAYDQVSATRLNTVALLCYSMREVLSTCPNCGDSFIAELSDNSTTEFASLPCSPECNLALVQE